MTYSKQLLVMIANLAGFVLVMFLLLFPNWMRLIQ
jgi:hypothetical protein